MMKKNAEPANVFDMRPRQLVGWEAGENGLAVVLVPKFRGRFSAKWIMPLLSKPHVRVKLDTFGSFVWRRCDGKTTVAEIADEMKNEFGNAAESADDRVAAFVLKLTRTDLVSLNQNEPDVQKTNEKER